MSKAEGEIIDLIELLRLRGYGVSTEQYLAVERLLLKLAALGHPPVDAARLRSLLAPVLCTTPEEQELFPKHFGEWAATRPAFLEELRAAADEREEAGLAAGDTLESPSPPWHRLTRRRAFIISGCALLLLALTAAFVGRRLFVPHRPGSVAGRVTDAGGSGIPGAAVSLGGAAVKTGKDGDFSLPLPLESLKPLELKISHDEYLDTSPYPVIDPNQPQSIRLERKGLPPPPTPVITPPNGKVTPSNLDPVASQTQEPTTFTQITPTPTQTQAVAPPTFLERHFEVFLWGTIFGPFLALGVWLAASRIRGWRLRKRSSATPPLVAQLAVKRLTERILKSAGSRRTSQELRRHRLVGPGDVDVQSTVRETVRRGLFTPSYGVRKASPEYLALIDSEGFSDQRAELSMSLVRQLHQNGVYIEKFFFRGDPRVCWKDEMSPHINLKELAGRFPNHSLLVFSDGAALFDPLTGKVRRWLEAFSPWSRRALLVPRLYMDDYRRGALAGAGFVVLPETGDGLAAVATLGEDGQIQKARDVAAKNFPELLRGRPGRWLDEHEPPRELVDTLLDQLRRYLGPDEYSWLCSCAIYPVLMLELTIYLGQEILVAKDLDERISLLLALPWFRHGSMPDWLRWRLVADLQGERDVRNALEELLSGAVPNGSGGTLAVALKQNKRRALWRLIKSEPRDSPLRDHVFLDFMSKSSLTVSVPKALLQLIYREGRPLLGVRTAFLLVVTILCAAAGTYAIDKSLNDVGPPEVVTLPGGSTPYMASPTFGERGATRQITISAVDCSLSRLAGASLSATQGSLIVVNNQVATKCHLTAELSIAANAPEGEVPLNIINGSDVLGVIRFTVLSPGEVVPCPILAINSRSLISDSSMRYRLSAVMNGAELAETQTISYNWSVTAGTLTSNPNAPYVIVDRSASDAANAEDTIVRLIIGGMDGRCPNSVVIAIPYSPRLLDVVSTPETVTLCPEGPLAFNSRTVSLVAQPDRVRFDVDSAEWQWTSDKGSSVVVGKPGTATLSLPPRPDEYTVNVTATVYEGGRRSVVYTGVGGVEVKRGCPESRLKISGCPSEPVRPGTNIRLTASDVNSNPIFPAESIRWEYKGINLPIASPVIRQNTSTLIIDTQGLANREFEVEANATLPVGTAAMSSGSMPIVSDKCFIRVAGAEPTPTPTPTPTSTPPIVARGDLTVTVRAGGKEGFAIITATQQGSEGYKDELSGKITKGGRDTFVFKGLPEGTYVIKLFHNNTGGTPVQKVTAEVKAGRENVSPPLFF